MLLHPDDLIHRLRRDRRRCFVITGRHGAGKTRLAQRMAERYQGQCVDLLTAFAVTPQLAHNVDTFSPRQLKTWLEPRLDGGLLLLDEIDFLWCTWSNIQKEEFLNILKIWSQPAFVGAFMLPDAVTERFEMLDQDRQPRIFSIHDLLAV